MNSKEQLTLGAVGSSVALLAITAESVIIVSANTRGAI